MSERVTTDAMMDAAMAAVRGDRAAMSGIWESLNAVIQEAVESMPRQAVSKAKRAGERAVSAEICGTVLRISWESGTMFLAFEGVGASVVARVETWNGGRIGWVHRIEADTSEAAELPVAAVAAGWHDFAQALA